MVLWMGDGGAVVPSHIDQKPEGTGVPSIGNRGCPDACSGGTELAQPPMPLRGIGASSYLHHLTELSQDRDTVTTTHSIHERWEFRVRGHVAIEPSRRPLRVSMASSASKSESMAGHVTWCRS